jgi:hypothetical protein
VGEFEALQLISRLWSWEMSENNNSSSGAQNGKRVKSPALENNLNASVNTILTIGVCIWDSSDSIIPVDVEECTTAGDICHYVGFSLSLTEDDCEYHRLMLVCTLTNETTQANCHHLRTLDNDERIYDIAKTVGTKQVKKSNYTFKDVAWYFKDVRSNPICFNNEEISGSSSEDEDAVFVSKDDLSYIMEAERRGYLYKRSSKDPNLWKRRFCALTDKFWCINTKRRDFKATCIPLYDDVLVQDSTPSFNFPHVIVVNCPWKVKYFRANNREEQQGWVEDLNERAQLSRENDVIHIAEMICCDEESNANDRIVKVMRPLFESDAVLISLLALDVNCCGSRYIKDYYFKAGFDMDSDSDEDDDSDDGFEGSSQFSTYQQYQDYHQQRQQQKQFLSNYDDFFDQIAVSLNSPNNEVFGKVSSRNSAAYYSNKFAAVALTVNNPAAYRHVAAQYTRYSLLEGTQFYNHYTDINTYITLGKSSNAYSSLSLVHALHDMNPSLATMLNFVNAVQRYKSLHRRDINIPNRVLWLEATTVFNRYLSKVPAMNKGSQRKSRKSTSPNKVAMLGSSKPDSPGRKRTDSNSNSAVNEEEFDTTYDHGLVFVSASLIEVVRDELVSFIALQKQAQTAEVEEESSADEQQPTAFAQPAPAASGFWSWLDPSTYASPSPVTTAAPVIHDKSGISSSSSSNEEKKEEGKDLAPLISALSELELDGWLGLMNVCVPAAIESASGMYEFVDRQPSLTLFDEIVDVIASILAADKLSLSRFYELANTRLTEAEIELMSPLKSQTSPPFSSVPADTPKTNSTRSAFVNRGDQVSQDVRNNNSSVSPALFEQLDADMFTAGKGGSVSVDIYGGIERDGFSNSDFPVSNYYVNGSGSGPSPDPYGEGQGQAELKRRGSMDAMDLYWYRDRSDNLFLL